MAEQIDGLLFSPVNAGSLTQGDLIRGMNKTLRIGSHPEQWQKNGIQYVTLSGFELAAPAGSYVPSPKADPARWGEAVPDSSITSRNPSGNPVFGEAWELTFRINRPVPRAVGARTGGTI